MIHSALGLPLPLALPGLGEDSRRVVWAGPPRCPE